MSLFYNKVQMQEKIDDEETISYLKAKIEKLEQTLDIFNIIECSYCREYNDMIDIVVCTLCEMDICRICVKDCHNCQNVFCQNCFELTLDNSNFNGHYYICQCCQQKDCVPNKICQTCNMCICKNCQYNCSHCDKIECFQCKQKCLQNKQKCRKCHFYDCTKCWQPDDFKLLMPSLQTKIKTLLLIFKHIQVIYHIPPRFIKYKIIRYFIKYNMQQIIQPLKIKKIVIDGYLVQRPTFH